MYRFLVACTTRQRVQNARVRGHKHGCDARRALIMCTGFKAHETSAVDYCTCTEHSLVCLLRQSKLCNARKCNCKILEIIFANWNFFVNILQDLDICEIEIVENRTFLAKIVSFITTNKINVLKGFQSKSNNIR